MPSLERSARVRAYLLRFWQVPSPEADCPPQWRFSLEDPHTGDKLGFPNLEALTEFLVGELASYNAR